jgi:hypothetical protein
MRAKRNKNQFDQGPRKKRREQHFIVRDLILALALCHNVTPVFPDENEPLKKEY